MAGFVEDTLHQQVRYIRPPLADRHENHVIRRSLPLRGTRWDRDDLLEWAGSSEPAYVGAPRQTRPYPAVRRVCVLVMCHL